MVNANEWLGMIPAFFIALLGWIYSIFILNRFRGFMQFTRIELISLLLFLLGGWAAWIAELCILHEHLVALQLCSSLLRSVVNWFGFLLVVNERLAVTRQQVGALLFVVTLALLWDAMHRIVLQ